jgi:methylglutaconyl-CoA hydratase
MLNSKFKQILFLNKLQKIGQLENINKINFVSKRNFTLISPSESLNNNEFILSKMTGKNQNILQIQLNSHKNRNALSRTLLDGLKTEINRINSTNEIRAAILLSAAPKYFCAGADLKERKNMSEEQVELFVNELRQTFQDFAEIRVPTIACIDGPALGGGLELALAADFRIGTKSSLIGLTEVALGIIPGAGGSQRLPRLIGEVKAKELIFTAERLSGEKALDLGILNYTVENYEDLEIKAMEIAEKIAINAPLAISAVKRAINLGIEQDLRTGLNIERLCYYQVIKTEDRLEGVKAFLEKRLPEYKGK